LLGTARRNDPPGWLKKDRTKGKVTMKRAKKEKKYPQAEKPFQAPEQQRGRVPRKTARTKESNVKLEGPPVDQKRIAFQAGKKKKYEKGMLAARALR